VSVSHEPFDTLAALHAVGALDGDDLRQFDAHLAAGCARCETVVRQTEQALARAAMAGPPEPPPAGVRDRLMRRAAASGVHGRRRWLPWAIGFGAVVAAAAFTAAYVAARYEARLGQMARESSVTKEHLARSEAALRDEVEAYRGAIELLRDPAARMVELRGQSGAPGAVARLLWTEKAGGLLVATQLPPVPAGKAYALWTMEAEAPRPAGVFVPDEGGRATLKVVAPPNGAPLRVLGVTLEPAGAVSAPTGAMMLAPR
jgi:anti-sigma-K factor RskA